MKSEEYKAGNVVAKPGLHFIAVESESDEYHLYPEEPAAIFQVFRHSWALARKKRPQVLIIEGLKLPNTNRPASYNAQYCSLFFRPWTLLEGDSTVPHLSLLGVDRKSLQVIYEQQIKSPLKAQRCDSQEPTTASVFDKVQWWSTWSEYVRGHIVSESSKNLIQSFLLRSMASSSKAPDDTESEANESGSDNDIPRLQVNSSRFEELLRPQGEITSGTKAANTEENQKKSFRSSVSQKHLRRK